MSSVCCSGVTRPVPDAAQWGLFKSTDGGASWAFIHNGAATTGACTGDLTEDNNGGTCSPRGVRHVVLDPSNPDIVYAGSYARGVWRSGDGGATWAQIKLSLNAAAIQTRPAIAVDASFRTGRRACTSTKATSALPTRVSSGATMWRPESLCFRDLDEQFAGHSRRRHVQPLHGPVLVRPVRPHAAGTSRCRVRRRILRLRRELVEQARRCPLHRRRRQLDRHDDGCDRHLPPQRPASRPARARDQPEQSVPVLRGQRWRRDALERLVRRRVGLVRRSESRHHQRHPAGPLQAGPLEGARPSSRA